MTKPGDSDRFSRWMANGLLATVAWGVVLVIYCTFRAFKIEDPLLGQAFLLLTGAWVGTLTLAQGRKTAQTEQAAEKAKETAEKVEAKVETLTQASTDSIVRADASEAREKEWSKHKDHAKEGGDEFYD